MPLIWAILPGLFAVQVFGASAQEQDLEFADALIELGFPDYAEKLVKQLVQQDTGLPDRIKLIRVKILVASRKFVEAEALIKTMPAKDLQTQACWMAIANGYLQVNDLEKAALIYTDFIDRNAVAGTDSANTNNTLVLEAAYRAAQIMEKTGDLGGAIKAYGRLLQLSAKEEVGLISKLQCAQANLYLVQARAASGAEQALALEAADKLCRTVIWRGVDLYFCQAVIMTAQIDLIRGNPAAARKKLIDNKAIFQQIDEYLRAQKDKDKLPLSLSPMAGGLFFLGKIDQAHGESLLVQNKDKGIEILLLAFKELNAVVAGYGESEWAPEAAARAQTVREKLQALGKTVAPVAVLAGTALPIGAPSATDAAMLAQMKTADNLFYNATNYPQAQSEYLRILNSNPDTTNSARLLMNLARCYVHQKDSLMARVTAQYLGERFADNPRAGTMLLQIGQTCSEQQDLDLLAAMYETFLADFPRHDSVPAVLFSMAIIRKKTGDEAAATSFLKRLIDRYPNDPHYLKAIDQAAWWSYSDKKYDQAAVYFQKFIAQNRDDKLKPQAQFGLANCSLSLEKYSEALQEFRAVKAALEGRLTQKDNTLSAAARKKQQEMLEQTLYLMAFCLSRLESPDEALPGYQQEAIALATESLQKYPESDWAPRTMSLQGTVQLARGQLDQAVETFNRLARLYPKSAEGKNALVSLVQSALNIKKYDVARDAFRKMMANKDFYLTDGKETIFAYIGRAMFDAGQYPEAIGAYRIVTASTTTNMGLLENGYFYLGSSCCENTNYTEAVTALNTLLTRFPQSGYYYDAKFLLGRAHRGLGQYKQVYEMLNDVATRATNIVLLNKASMELSKTQISQGLKKEALASLMRVTLLADSNNPELRPMLEEAFMESLQLQQEFKARDDIMETCRQYLAKFPAGASVAEVGRIMRAAELLPAAPPP